jgi:multiple sugar transport system permease protein
MGLTMNNTVKSLERKDRIQAYALLTPGLLVLLILALYPLLYSLYLSFSSWDLRNPNSSIEFIGFGNYIKVLSSKDFGASLFTTLKFIFFALILEICLGLLTALVITNERVSNRMASIFRATLILTIVMIPVVSGILWRTILQKHYGPLNYFLSFLGIPEIAWLSTPKTAFLSIVMVDVWQQTTMSTLIFIGGLLGINKNYLEAAKIDGCGGIRLLWHIILPMLKPIFAIILLLRSIALLKVFDFIYSMTYGGPGSATEVVNLHIFRLGLQYLDFTRAAAASWVLLLMLLPLTLFLTLKVFLPKQE